MPWRASKRRGRKIHFPVAMAQKNIVRWAVQPWRRGNGQIGGLTMFRMIADQVRAREERRSLRNQLLQAQKIEALGTLAAALPATSTIFWR